ncbi:MAG: amidohydrolase, partial [Clostridiaceae bacterium]|nr:amidohydrolase [Clostridiaceae bacterium]
ENELQDNVLLIFQPAEEGPGGAEIIVSKGILERYNVTCIFGLHIFPDIEEGKIGCRPGALMAQTGEFDLCIRGKSCHGAMPHKGNDALVAASDIVLALNTIVSRFVDPVEPAVVTVGRMVCGEIRNVIAGEALLEGTMRAFNDNTYDILRSRVIKIANSISDAYGCDCTYEIRDMYPAVNNDRKLFEKLLVDLNGDDFVYLKPLMLAEDFSYYQKRIPGLFLMLGAGNIEKGYIHPLHSSKFNFNEEILILGVQVFYNLLRR